MTDVTAAPLARGASHAINVSTQVSSLDPWRAGKYFLEAVIHTSVLVELSDMTLGI